MRVTFGCSGAYRRVAFLTVFLPVALTMGPGCGDVEGDDIVGVTDAIRAGDTVAQNDTGLVAFFFRDGAPCSGVYLGNRWVLTAKHCVVDEARGVDWPRSGYLVTSILNPGTRRPTWLTLGTGSGVSLVRKHDTIDLAMLKLTAALTVPTPSGRSGTTNSVLNQDLLCQGYGWVSATSETVGTGAGRARSAFLTARSRAIPLSSWQLVIGENARDQIAQPGDSGGPCFKPFSTPFGDGVRVTAIMLSVTPNAVSADTLFAVSVAGDTPWNSWINARLAE